MTFKTCQRALIALSLTLMALQLSGCATGGARPSWLGPTADDRGRHILSRTDEMIDQGVIIQGDCWDYINTVYNRAGYPEARRYKVFAGGKKGPYVSTSIIRPGDWLYFINHSYNNIEHSAIFVEWVNKGAKQARMVSYAGEKRREPARYMNYDLSSVYMVIRARP